MAGPITTHVLDTTIGMPAAGIEAILAFESSPGKWKQIGSGTTNSDGRISGLLPDSHRLLTGTYQITFQTGPYFETRQVEAFYPYVQIVFEIRDTGRHYHVPLLLNPFGYSTYRGS